MKAKKSLGQNFLNDSNVLSMIANSTNASSNDLILEIGPGTGMLTGKLIETGAKVISFEIDERMHECLDQLEGDNLTVIYGDFLDYDLLKLPLKSFNNIYVIANIPYYISTPIIKKIISYKNYFNEIVLLVQKEYAQRVCAKCNCHDYDSLSVFVNFYYDTQILFNVGRKCFSPAPKVDSAVMKLTPVTRESIDESKFLNFINECFSQKRKTLKNNLSSDSWNSLKDILYKYGFNDNVRAEQISLEQFIELFKCLEK